MFCVEFFLDSVGTYGAYQQEYFLCPIKAGERVKEVRRIFGIKDATISTLDLDIQE
jgi:hypothetical protein